MYYLIKQIFTECLSCARHHLGINLGDTEANNTTSSGADILERVTVIIRRVKEIKRG